MAGAVIGVALGAAAAASPSAEIVDEVVVTATKREERLTDIPASISVLDDETITVLRGGGADIRTLAARAPGLNIESSFGRAFPRFYVRGLGNIDFDLNASQPVGLLVDGVVRENPAIKGAPLFDLDRVEVLRGPQGTLFGRNTPAGLVKIETRRPTDTLEAFGRFGFGRFGTVEAEGAVSGPLSGERFRGRIAALIQRRADWIDNTFIGEDNAVGGFLDLAGRVHFEADLTENSQLALTAHARRLDGTARLFRANVIVPGTNELVEGFRRDQVALDGQNAQESEQYGVRLEWTYDVGAVSLLSLTGYETAMLTSRGDIDGGFGEASAPPSGPGVISFSSETQDRVPRVDQLTQELRITRRDPGRWDLQGGVFFLFEQVEVETASFDSLAGGALDGLALQSQEARSAAVFGSFRADVTRRLSVRGGVRYAYDDKELTAERVMAPGGGAPSPPKTVALDDGVVSWDASLRYQAAENVSVFGRAARGFRAPSLQGRILFAGGDGADPDRDGVSSAATETIFSNEAGFRGAFWDRRLRLHATVFRYVVQDLQLTAIGGAANVTQLVNADKARGRGFEFELDARPTTAWRAKLALGFADTEIDDPNLVAPICGAPCTVLDPVETDDNGDLVARIDGNRLPRAPRWTIGATLRYARPIGPGEAYMLMDWAYRSESGFFLYDSVEFRDDAFEGGIKVGFSVCDGRYEAALIGRNITNDVSRLGGLDFNNLTGFVNAPAYWGVAFSARR